MCFGNTPRSFTPKFQHITPHWDLHLFTQPFWFLHMECELQFSGSPLELLSPHLDLKTFAVQKLLLLTQMLSELGADSQLHLLKGSLRRRLWVLHPVPQAYPYHITLYRGECERQSYLCHKRYSKVFYQDQSNFAKLSVVICVLEPAACTHIFIRGMCKSDLTLWKVFFEEQEEKWKNWERERKGHWLCAIN